ncbi:MAG TPA: nuclear transport factor 2 family protein [Myxococcales bacterium]|nr:nuclear transport factor 2 family protein [Myxococcales bacterium]
MIEQFIENWHKYLKGQLPGGLDELLAEDVIFYSPVVYTPQEGREITKLYLAAAASTFGGDGPKDAGSGATDSSGPGSFHYTKQILSGNQAVLEFESSVGGKYINGVDILECNDDGLLTEFRVMVRPLQAVNMLHQQMGAMLKKMQAA